MTFDIPIALLYTLLSALVTLIGGALPLYTTLKHIDLRYLIGFSAGVILAVAFLDMLPELRPGTQVDFFAIGVGFFALYIIEKLVMIHACGEHECKQHTVGWVSIIGIAAESIIDGAAIAIGFAVEPSLGLLIAAAVILHELPRGFSTSVIMRTAKFNHKKIWSFLAIDAFFTPLGALLVFAGIFSQGMLKPLLAFAAGTFIYIGASDLLPEAHKVFNIKVVGSVILGLVLVVATTLIFEV